MPQQKAMRAVNAASKIRETGWYKYTAYKVSFAREGSQLVWDCIANEKVENEKKAHELSVWTSSEYGNGTDLTSMISAMIGGGEIPADRVDELDLTKCLSIPFMAYVEKLPSTKTDGAFINKATDFGVVNPEGKQVYPSYEALLTPLE